MSTSEHTRRTAGYGIDVMLVPDPVRYLRDLRQEGRRTSLFLAIVVGCSYLEGLSMQWIERTLRHKGLPFDWRRELPHLQLSQKFALLNSLRLISYEEFKKFKQAADYRNHVVHKMHSKWTEKKAKLQQMVDLNIELLEMINARRKKDDGNTTVH